MKGIKEIKFYKKIIIRIFTVITAFAVITFVPNIDGFALSRESINPNIKTIRVVLDDNYPPFIFKDSAGNPQGIIVDQWKLWEKKTGIKVELYPISWDMAQADMKNGKYDAIDTIFQNAEREKLYDFTKPYAKIDANIFFPKEICGITGVGSLEGFSVAVKSGDASIMYLLSNGISDLRLYESYEDIINATKSGEVSIFVMDRQPAQYFMYRDNIQTKFNYSKPLYTEEFHRAVLKGNTAMLDTIKKGFSLISEKEYSKINRKWYVEEQSSNKYPIYLLYMLGMILLLSLMLVKMNHTLKSKVREKTKKLKDMIDVLKESQERQTKQAWLINSLLDTIPDIIFYKNTEGAYIGCNLQFQRLVGVPDKEIVGKTDYDLFDRENASTYIGHDIEVMETKKTKNYDEIKIYSTGEKCYFDMLKAPYLDANGNIIGIIGVGRDMSERKKNEEEVLYIGYHDQLTDLYNRRFYEEEITRLDIKRNLPLTVAIGDVNGLKFMNDSFGHSVGDDLLIRVAEALKVSCRGDDIISRFGGDEFAILLPTTNCYEAEMIISRIKDILLKDKMYGINISISFGIKTKVDEKENILDIIKNAEDDMYRHKLYESTSMRSKPIDLIMNTLYEKNHREMLHSKRVSKLCEKIAKKMDMNVDKISQVRTAGLVHDIGKIGVDERILNSSRKLDANQWEEIKKHSEIGFRILSSVGEFSEIAEFVLQHQEKWDGTGYPRGLKGDQISMEARIIAIADAYDAMTSERTYGKVMTEEKAIAEIKRCVGTQFDPEIAMIFIEKVLPYNSI
ncbi:MAG: transporter substrate-binding domain-containing protein [Peptostreptococcaceae bacterium]|nr:transporter substrate-binding domain-containing protein [Peptostreptococcaceae bacterium]